MIPNKEECGYCTSFDVDNNNCKKGRTLVEKQIVVPWCPSFNNKHVIKAMQSSLEGVK